MPPCRFHLAALLGMALPLGACAELDRIGAARMQEVPTAQLCEWRGNPISGGQMRRELARRGEDCGLSRPVLAEAPPPLAEPEPGLEPRPEPAPLPEPVALPAEPEAADRQAPRPEPVAPLVTPACAERILRRSTGDAAPHAVSFTNRCDFPIKVLYAADRSKTLSQSTDLLRPGEQTDFARIADGLDLPGYVVCSYASAPASAPCRIGP